MKRKKAEKRDGTGLTLDKMCMFITKIYAYVNIIVVKVRNMLPFNLVDTGQCFLVNPPLPW